MENAIPALTPELLQDIFLLQRERVVAKVNEVFDGKTRELCLRTRYPKQVAGFISACLSQRGELESGAGARCFFVRDRATWESLCSPEHDANLILVADPELDFASARGDLLPPARARGHGVIYSLANPRPDTPEVFSLNEPKEFEVLELLKKHKFPDGEAAKLAKRSNGNIYLLTRLLTGTSDRPAWAADDTGFHFRHLALLGGWNDASEKDQNAISEIVGEPYETWVQRVYPLTKKDEPPVLLDGKSFRAVSRYESWQQLGHFLNDADLRRFGKAATTVLSVTSPEFDLPKNERQFAGMKPQPETYSAALRSGLAETLALLGAQGDTLPCSPNLGRDTANGVVFSLLKDADWKRWASLSSVMPQLAEAAPTVFLDTLARALENIEASPLREVFGAYEHPMFGRNYHCGLLWALEVLAWNQDHLSRVCIALARLSRFPLPHNAGNNAPSTLRSIFLTWLPQTLASVEARRAAVESVIQEDPEVGWNLLLAILPEGNQIGNYNQKPAWRDWFPGDWSEGVTRSEMHRQIRNYSELAVQIAMGEVTKLSEIIGRWDHLPREVFQQVLDYLQSPRALERPDEERFALWEKLTQEVDRHRKYAKADWAMPEEELKRLEATAEAIKPTDPAIVHQRLFNAYDHDFFETDDYDEERKKLIAIRERAVAEVLDRYGPARILDMARSVKLPVELGSALGRMGTPELDGFLLPRLLGESDKALDELVRGYVWARYHATSIDWVKALDLAAWTPVQTGLFFAYLPFVADVWNLAEERLGQNLPEYWSRIFPNPFQAQDDLLEAVHKALANQRPDIAIACINSLRHLRREIPTRLATDAVKGLLTSDLSAERFDRHALLEVIKQLQRAPDADVTDVSWIEFQCLKLLDRFSGASPVFLERRLATEPAFFHEAITTCFRSEHDRDKPVEVDERKKGLAELTFGLLHNWQTPPGSTTEKTIDESAFTAWIQGTRDLCQHSGHWPIAQQTIGSSLIHHPVGLDGLTKYPAVAKCLDAPEHEDMRRGFTIALFNSRGVHGFSAGKDELKIAKEYRAQADKLDLQKLTRIATTLRGLAESYEREAERAAKSDPFSD